MLAHGDGLLDQVVEVLGERGRQAVGLQDAEDLVARDGLDLRDAEAVAEGHADLGGREALLGELADVVAHVLRLHLDPGRGLAAVGRRRGGDALALSVHAAHVSEGGRRGRAS